MSRQADDFLAYFITFTTYGTRVHGDERASFKRGRFGRASYALEADAARESRARSAMLQEPFVLGEPERRRVSESIAEVCDVRAWRLHAINVRTNHVQVLVSAEVSPESVMHACKAWSTRRLREDGLIASDRRVWTRHGSTRYINNGEAFRRVVEYVVERQGEEIWDGWSPSSTSSTLPSITVGPGGLLPVSATNARPTPALPSGSSFPCPAH